MAKERSFASKMVKGPGKNVVQCSVCKGPVTNALYVRSVFSDKTHSWKYNEGQVKICKCNQNEVYGS